MANKLASNCKVCNGYIEQRRTFFSTYGTCSSDCYKKAKENQVNYLKSKFNNIDCPVCGTTFRPTQVQQIRCSKECTSAFNLSKVENKKQTEFSIFKRDEFKCIYCGKSSIEDGVRLHIEHITPLILGGLSSIDNLITACQYCNSSKGDKYLSTEIVERIYKVLLIRNNNIGIKQHSDIVREIYLMQNGHHRRIKMLKNGIVLPLPGEQEEFKFKP
jgi:5-methylcytosine-specific restriction endonuclease McrA